MNLKCEIKQKISKSGNPYHVLVIYLTDTCSKETYLEPAEVELLKINKDKMDFPGFISE